MFRRFDSDFWGVMGAIVAGTCIALWLISCEGATSLTIPTSILAPMDSASASAEAISITSSGQTIILNAVRNETETSLDSYIELEVLPSALSNVRITRNDTQYGSDVSMEAVASEPKIGLWREIATHAAAFLSGLFVATAAAP